MHRNYRKPFRRLSVSHQELTEAGNVSPDINLNTGSF
jgi:hypothetical protein